MGSTGRRNETGQRAARQVCIREAHPDERGLRVGSKAVRSHNEFTRWGHTMRSHTSGLVRSGAQAAELSAGAHAWGMHGCMAWGGPRFWRRLLHPVRHACDGARAPCEPCASGHPPGESHGCTAHGRACMRSGAPRAPRPCHDARDLPPATIQVRTRIVLSISYLSGHTSGLSGFQERDHACESLPQGQALRPWPQC